MEGEVGAEAVPQEEEEADAEAELATNQSDDSGVGVLKSDAAGQDAVSTSDSAEGDIPQDPEQEQRAAPPSEEAQPKPAPVPAPRISFRSTESRPLMKAKQETSEEESAADLGEDCSSINPPALLYKVQLS